MAKQLESETWKSVITLETLNFDNRTVKSLPIDRQEKNFVRKVRGACFSWVQPTPCVNPRTVSYSSAMKLLDLDEEECQRPDFSQFFCGNKLLPGCKPAAHCYSGHQFGSFARQLGDGATMYLGEVINSKNERWEIQFKGAGRTPYSRSADGRKVLRSSIREYLCSEAMHHLGIPTTRAGCCIVSDSTVVRDAFFDGHPKQENCSIVLRIAETFLRIGSFEICKPDGPSFGKIDILRALLEYTISSFYPEIYKKFPNDAERRYKEFFKELVVRTSKLVAQWQCVGFCHGVLNTDNTSITGLTLDYGPFGFMERYNADHLCNNSDNYGRYSYINQPKILKWNLEKLIEALNDIIPKSELLPILETYDSIFEDSYIGIMRNKFGLLAPDDSDRELIDKFWDAMDQTHADFTNCFRSLSSVTFNEECDFEAQKLKLIEILIKHSSSAEELKRFHKLDFKTLPPRVSLISCNLRRMLFERMRHHTKYESVEFFQNMTQKDKDEADGKIWSEWVTMYLQRMQSEAKKQASLSDWNGLRIKLMNRSNPKYVLRNYIAQEAISAAEKGDYSEVNKVLQLLSYPYEDSAKNPEDYTEPEYSRLHPGCSFPLLVT